MLAFLSNQQALLFPLRSLSGKFVYNIKWYYKTNLKKFILFYKSDKLIENR